MKIAGKDFIFPYYLVIFLYSLCGFISPGASQIILQSVSHKYTANGESISIASGSSRSLAVQLNFPQPLCQNPNATYFSIYAFKFNTNKCGVQLQLVSLSESGAEVNIIAPANVGIDMLEFAFLTGAYNGIVTLSLPVSSIPGYTLGAGSGLRSFISTLTYSPSDASLFVTPYVFFGISEIEFTSNQEIALSWQTTLNPSFQIDLELETKGTSAITSLHGYVLVVADQIANNIGFGTNFANFGGINPSVLSPPSNGIVFTDKVSMSFDTRTDYTAIPVFIPVLREFYLGPSQPSLQITTILGSDLNQDNTLDNFVTIYLKNKYPAQIYSLIYSAFIFCDLGDLCFQSSSREEIGLQGESFDLDLEGLPISKSSATIREEEYNIAFPEFFATRPKYFALGLMGIKTSDFLLQLSLNYLNHSSNAFKFKIAMKDNDYVNQLQVSYFASNWDGIQAYYLDFAANCTNFATFQSSTGDRNLTCSVNLTQAADFTGKDLNAFVLFTHWLVLNAGTKFFLSYTMLSVSSTQANFVISTQDTMQFGELKGFLFVYEKTSDYNLNHYRNLQTSTFPLDSGSGVRHFPMTLDLKRRYPFKPNIFVGLSALTYDITTEPILLHDGDYDLYPPGNNLVLFPEYTTESTSKIYMFEYNYISFCPRVYQCNVVADQFITTPNSTIPQSIYLTSDFNLKYAVIVTRLSDYQDGMLVFDESLFAIPEIITSAIFNPSSLYDGVATISAFEISSPATLSFQLFQIIFGDVWNVQGITDVKLYELPINQNYTKESLVGSLSDLPRSPWEYQSLVATKLLSHDQTQDFRCKVKISFTGSLRNLYLNSQSLLRDSALDPKTPATTTTSVGGVFKGSQIAVLTIIGYQLIIKDVQFVECTYASNATTLTPKFLSFYLNKRLDTSFTVDYPTSTSSCAADCLTCFSVSYCVKCKDGFHLHNGNCFGLCLDNIYRVPAPNEICDKTARGSAISLNPTRYDETLNTISTKYLIDSQEQISRILIIYFPYYPVHRNIPKPSHLPAYLPSLSEAKYTIKTMLSERGPYTIQSFDLIIGYATIANPYVRVLAYSLSAPDTFTIVSYAENSSILAQTMTNLVKMDPNLVSSFGQFEIYFLLSCRTPCFITLKFIGTVDAYKNERTLMFTATTKTYFEYQFTQGLTDLNFITFKGTNCTEFSFEISGDHIIYTLENFLLEDSFRIPVNPCLIENCINCEGKRCLSCEKGYFLSVDSSSCLQSCPKNQLENHYEQLCVSVASAQLLELSNTLGLILGGIAGGIIGMSYLIVLMGGSPQILFKQISFFQEHILLLFFNINYPPHLDNLLQIITFTTLSYFPNPFAWFVPKLDIYEINSAYRFANKGYKNIFLKNTGNLIFVLLILVIVHLLSKALTDMSKGKFKKTSAAIKERAGIGIAYRFVISCPLIFYIPIVLQLKELKFKNAVYIASWISALLFSLLYVGIMLFIILKNRAISKDKMFDRAVLYEKYFIFYEDHFVEEKVLSKLFLPYRLIKQLASAILLITLYQFPIPQVATQLGLSLLHLLVLLFTDTFTDRSIYKLEILIQTIQIVINGIFLYLSIGLNDRLDTDVGRIAVGWILFGLVTLKVVIIQGFWLARSFKFVKSHVSNYIQLRKERRLGKLNRVKGPYKPTPPLFDDDVNSHFMILHRLRQILKPRAAALRSGPEPVGKFGIKFDNILGESRKKRTIRPEK